jgi:MarR family transcriptional regulator, lower aerobic nicotinate degradation pathway regulator
MQPIGSQWRRVRAALAAQDLKPRQVYILDVLAQHGPVGQRELGDMLDVDHSVLVTLLNPLDRAGLLERQRSEQDRRRHHVLITPAGRRLLEQAMSTVERVQADFLRPLDDRSQVRLQHMLETLRSEYSRGLNPDECES